jgi:signal transduction histidine kinase/DNA-binding response OmpR family regulator
MRAKDWSQTPLGAPDLWPQSLKTCVRIVLTSRQPMFVWWGESLINLYNDAYKAIVGGKHPEALGQPAAIVWREIWDQVGPRAETAIRRNEGTYDEALLLIMERYGYKEETHYTFSYSPVPNDQGGTGGIICANTDDTERIIGERQLALLKELGIRAAETRTVAAACEAAADALRTNPRDLPFAAIYLLDPGQRRMTLVCCAGIAEGHPAAPATADLADDRVWPFAEAMQTGIPGVVKDLGAKFGALPCGAWDRPPDQAVVLPLPRQGETGLTGVLVAAMNPYRLYDQGYQRFLGLLAGQIAAGIANARAYEAERQRAEALAELDRAKTLFFSNVSHEFRTPLTLMLAPLEDVLNDPSPDALTQVQRQQLHVVHRNSLRLLKLVNTLLDFSRIEAGRVHATYQPTDLAVLTADLASGFRSAVERAGLFLRIDCPPLPEPVFVDREMWEKVVLNQLSNAFKFTFEGGITVALRAADGHAVLIVQDTGVGIPADELPRLFERFHRIQGQRSRSFEGSGIGLALVHELVRLHGGTIAAESKPGQGTGFTVAIPLGSAHLPAERIAAEPSAGARGHPGTFVEEALRWLPEMDAGGIELAEAAAPSDGAPRATVLLADDNADMRDYVRRLLGGRHEVVVAADGAEALRMIRQRRPDLVLSDAMMPNLDGFGLLRAIRADPGLRDLPVILLSARAGEEARAEGLGAGADDYLIKPFAARELMARVGANLAMMRVRQTATAALREESNALEILNRTGARIAAELDPDKLVQLVVDAGVELTGAQFGAFIYNVTDDAGENFASYALSGVPREAFAGFRPPRRTALFAATFSGEGTIRSGDITRDPRCGRDAPFHGLPPGHLPVRSYLAAPVVSRSGDVTGGLFFGHEQPDVFSERSERLMQGLAAQAAIGIDNARLFQAVQRLNATLETEVEQRTAELRLALKKLRTEAAERQQAEDTLRQAQKMEAIGQLTGGIAHDFNNLLTGVAGSLELLQARVAQGRTGDLGRYVTAAMTSVTRASALTHRLLAFARRQALDPKPTSLNRLVASMEELIRRTVGPAVQVETVLAAGLWLTLCDANQLESALLNLCINARDAMPEGGRLTIETANAYIDDTYAATERDVRPGQYVSLSVTDTGTGMTPDVMARAFEPFFTTKPIGQGTGLGLSMLYGFVKQSEGHVRIYSEAGHGTMVRLYLPRHQSETAFAEPAGPDVNEAAALPAGTGETVLVVEDEAVVRALVVEVLTELGYTALEAGDGPAGLRILQSDVRVDLLISDVGLPGMNGRQLADAARVRRPELKVLFITGYAHNAAIGNGFLEAGMAMVAKPFAMETLATKVRAMIEDGAAPPNRPARPDLSGTSG